MPKALKIVAAIMVALASAAIGWFGVKWYQGSRPAADPTPTSSPSPTASDVAYVHLTFRLDDATAAVDGLVPQPRCGDRWSGEPATANGVKLAVDATVENIDGVDHLNVTAKYTTTTQEPVAFLGTEGHYIITRDDIVVSPDWGAEYVPQYYVAIPGSNTEAGDGVGLTGPTLCDVADQLAAIWAEVDFETATPEDIAAAQEATEAFNRQNALLPSGEYKIYAVAPVVLGEAAAIARALSEEGVDNIGTLTYSIGDSPLGTDARLDPYCTDELDANGDVVARNCDVPQDVLAEIIARDVPQAYVIDGPPALAVSEPVVITIP